MKANLHLFFLLFFIASCNNFGTSRVKNLVDLTEHMKVEAEEKITISDSKQIQFLDKKSSSYKLSKAALISEPIVAKGVMYTIDKNGFLSAFSLKDKKILWTSNISDFDKGDSFVGGGITHSEGKLYITNGTRYLIVVDVADGMELVRKKFPDIIITKPIVLSSEVVVIKTISNQLLAYDVKNTKILWAEDGGIEVISTSHQIDPVLYNNNLLVSYSSGFMSYINVKDGSLIWKHQFSKIGDMSAPSLNPSVLTAKPVIDGDFVYCASSKGKLTKIDLRDGTVVWEKNAADIHSMMLHENLLYLTNNARQIFAINKNTAKVTWVGRLISAKADKSKKIPVALFHVPFISKNIDAKDGVKFFSLNVIAGNGELYSFRLDDSGRFPEYPEVISIAKNTRYHWISCCSSKLHLISGNKIQF